MTTDPAQIEETLCAALPSTQHAYVPQLALALAEAASGAAPPETLRARLAGQPALVPLLRQLAGQELVAGDLVLSFALEPLRERAAGQPLDAGVDVQIARRGGLVAPAQVDNRQVNVSAGTVEGLLVAFNEGTINYTGVSVNIATGTRLDRAAQPAIARGPNPQPPLPLLKFFDRQQPLAELEHAIRPRSGVWLNGALGCGLTAMLKQAANAPAAGALPDGVLYVDGAAEPSDPNDLVQSIYNCFYKSAGGETLRPDPKSARVELGGLGALFVLDRPQLSSDVAASLASSLAGRGAVLIAADGPAPDTLLDLPLDGLPDQDALALVAAEARVDVAQPATAALIERLCAALDCLPLAMVIAARLVRAKVAPLPQLVAVAEDLRDERLPLARAARLALTALGPDERAVLGALVRGGSSATLDALAAIAALPPDAAEDAAARLLALRLVSLHDGHYALAAGSLRRVLARLLPASDERRRAAAFYAGAAAERLDDVRWAAQEWPNLLRAARGALAHNPAQAGALARAAQPHFVLAGWWGAWEKSIDLADQAAQASGDQALRAWALHERGTRAGLLGDLPTAQASLEAARQMRLQLGDNAGAAATLHNLDYLGLLPPLGPNPLDESPPHLPRRLPRWLVPLLVAVPLLLGAGVAGVLSMSSNSAPVAADDTATTFQDTPLTIAVTANDRDDNGDNLMIAAGPTSDQGGVVAVASDGVIYTPPAGFVGSDSFGYTVTDDQGASASGRVLIQVAPPDFPPLAADDTASTDEDQPLVITLDQLLANDTVAAERQLTITAVEATALQTSTVRLNGDAIVYTPPADYNGPDSFSYTVADDQGRASSALVSITVNPINDAPTATADRVRTDEAQTLTIPFATLLRNDTDADGDQLAVAEVSPRSAQGGEVRLTEEAVVYTPPANFNSEDSFSYSASDGRSSATAIVTITVDPVNDAPVAANDQLRARQNTPLAFPAASLARNDTDADGDPLRVVEVSSRSERGGTVTLANGNITYTPPPRYSGADSFSYTVTDEQGGNASATVAVTVVFVNQAPVAADDTFDAQTGGLLTFPAARLLANDRDTDGGQLAVTRVESPSREGGTVALANGNITYTPPTRPSGAAFSGSDSFAYTISDGQGGNASAVVTVNVRSTAPIAADDALNGLEQQTVRFSGARLLQNDRDPDGDALRVTEVEARTSQGGTVRKVEGQDEYFYAPPSIPGGYFVGQDSFGYTISDDDGNSDSATVTVTISPTNKLPRAGADKFSTPRNRPLVVSASQLLANDVDPDNDPLTLTEVSSRSALGGTVALDGDKLTYTPPSTAGPVGSDSFTYTVSDGRGGSAVGQVTIGFSNTAPVLKDDAEAADERQTLVIPIARLLANDADPDGDALKLTDVGSRSEQGGSVQIRDNAVVYMPPFLTSGYFVGQDSFSYTVSDGQNSATAQVRITVRKVNRAPLTKDDAETADEAQTLVIPIARLLVNDADPDGDRFTLVEVSPRSQQGGSVQIRDNAVVYTPPFLASGYFVGQDSFSYTVSDGQGGSASAQVTITVQQRNSAPVAKDDQAMAQSTTTTSIPLDQLLANDTDPDQDRLTVSAVSAQTAQGGTVALEGNTVVYTPPQLPSSYGFVGQDSFTYTVSDGKGGTSTATVFVFVG